MRTFRLSRGTIIPTSDSSTTSSSTTREQQNSIRSSSSNTQLTSSIPRSSSTTSRYNDLWINLLITFEDSLGYKPSPVVLRALCSWCERVGFDVVDYALSEAAAAPRPSWRYAQAILHRCEGLHINKRPGESVYSAIQRARTVKDGLEDFDVRDQLRKSFPSS